MIYSLNLIHYFFILYLLQISQKKTLIKSLIFFLSNFIKYFLKTKAVFSNKSTILNKHKIQKKPLIIINNLANY